MKIHSTLKGLTAGASFVAILNFAVPVAQASVLDSESLQGAHKAQPTADKAKKKDKGKKGDNHCGAKKGDKEKHCGAEKHKDGMPEDEPK